jgi:C1A family cysteine protease
MVMNRCRCWAVVSIVLALASPPSRAQGDRCDGKAAELQTAIKNRGAKWVSRLPRAEATMTGLTLAPLDAPLLPALTEAGAAVLPRRLDWRERGAVSGIRDQGSCGSCWAFAVTQALESQIMMAKKDSKDVSLSEQVVVSCSGAGSCNGGRPDIASNFIASVGVPPESDYPYTAANGSCGSAKAGWKNRAYKIGAWNSVPNNVAALKSALVNYGPMPTILDLRKDFKYYESGVYSYVPGAEWGCAGQDSRGKDNDEWGWHAVLLVGYDDDGQYFIVKNSWGPGWGENGFFRIAYSELRTKVFFANQTLAYLPPRTSAEPETVSRKTEEPVSYGIGAHLYGDPEEGTVVVESIIPGGSAESQGLKEGDRIDAVDSAGDGRFVKLSGKDMASVLQLIRGRQNTGLVLRVTRAGKTTEIPFLRNFESTPVDRIEQEKHALQGIARVVGRMSDAGYAGAARRVLTKRFPKAAAGLATRSGALSAAHKTLAACEYAEALQLGASYASVQSVSRALKNRLADPALLEGPAVMEAWSVLAGAPPEPNAAAELRRQALSHFEAGKYFESLAADFRAEAAFGEGAMASRDSKDGDAGDSVAEAFVSVTLAPQEGGAGACNWTPPGTGCSNCPCSQGAQCSYCVKDPGVAACGGAKPQCPTHPRLCTCYSGDPINCNVETYWAPECNQNAEHHCNPDIKDCQKHLVECFCCNSERAPIHWRANSCNDSRRPSACDAQIKPNDNGTCTVPPHIPCSCCEPSSHQVRDWFGDSSCADQLKPSCDPNWHVVVDTQGRRGCIPGTGTESETPSESQGGEPGSAPAPDESEMNDQEKEMHQNVEKSKPQANP